MHLLCPRNSLGRRNCHRSKHGSNQKRLSSREKPKVGTFGELCSLYWIWSHDTSTRPSVAKFGPNSVVSKVGLCKSVGNRVQQQVKCSNVSFTDPQNLQSLVSEKPAAQHLSLVMEHTTMADSQKENMETKLCHCCFKTVVPATDKSKSRKPLHDFVSLRGSFVARK